MVYSNYGAAAVIPTGPALPPQFGNTVSELRKENLMDPSPESRRQFFATEFSAMRSEINATLDRMNNNENFCAGSCAALITYASSNQSSGPAALAAVAATAISLFGALRYAQLRRHAHLIDLYVDQIEKSIDEAGGWVSWYAAHRNHSEWSSYSTTRIVFWVSLVGLSFGMAIYRLVR